MIKMRRYNRWTITIILKDKKVFYDILELLNKILIIIDKDQIVEN